MLLMLCLCVCVFGLAKVGGDLGLGGLFGEVYWERVWFDLGGLRDISFFLFGGRKERGWFASSLSLYFYFHFFFQ